MSMPYIGGMALTHIIPKPPLLKGDYFGFERRSYTTSNRSYAMIFQGVNRIHTLGHCVLVRTSTCVYTVGVYTRYELQGHLYGAKGYS